MCIIQECELHLQHICLCFSFSTEPATITEAPQSITINETDSTTFTCSVTGVPLPSTTWTLPDRRNITALDQQSEEPPRIYAQSITSEETPYATMSTLFIDSASRSDEGAYTCTAMNDDSIASSSATLTVQGKFSITVNMHT